MSKTFQPNPEQGHYQRELELLLEIIKKKNSFNQI
jgi:hypothetical protein